MTSKGPVQGEWRNNSVANDEEYVAFHGIPYAAPPIGSLRFKAPEEHVNWTDVYDATNPNTPQKCCPQVYVHNT